MGALSASSSFATAVRNKPDEPAARRSLLFTSAALLLLLVFITCAVFVQQSWALQSFQIGIYLLVAIHVLAGIRGGREVLAGSWTARVVYLVPVWGIVQIVFHTTASMYETRLAVLRWGALAGVFFLAQIVGQSQASRRVILNAFLLFAVAMAVLCLTGLFTSEGKVFWLFSSGYPNVFATFPNKNNYSQFAELALPIAVWWAMQKQLHSWAYALAAGVIYASLIGCASRAGAILSSAELLVLFVAGLVSSFRHQPGWTWRSTASVFALVPVLAAVFTFAVGWQRVLQRFENKDPYAGRREFFISAVDMAKSRPLVGFGLDTFPEVYQRFAIMDSDAYANHAHNDWAEFAADGGIPFLILLLIPFAAAVPIAIRHPWGVGLIAVMLHACVDYPFPRPAVSGWMFVLLALLYMARTEDLQRVRQASASARNPQLLTFKRRDPAAGPQQ